MSAGNTIGKFIGSSAAYAKHGALSAARASGQFGQDVLTGTKAGYDAKDAELAARRAAALEAYRAAATQQAPVKIKRGAKPVAA